MKKRLNWIYGIILVLFLYILYYFKDSDHFLGAISFVLTILLFHLSDKVFKIEFKIYHYIIIILMALFGLLFSPFYFIFPFYDKVLHLVNPFLGCFLVFYIINKLKIDLKTKLIFTFSVLITLVTFAEIVEFLLDSFFDLKLQGVFEGDFVGTFKILSGEFRVLQDRITDTMFDLIFGVLGGISFVFVKLFSKKIKDKY